MVSIAAIAQKYAQMGSTKWSKDSDIWPGRGEDKCNIFVADVVIEAGGSVPMRHPVLKPYSPIGAGEWANPNSTYLRDDPNWTLVRGPPEIGDVVGKLTHVGIVSAHGATTSAREKKVLTDRFGLDGGATFWRYVGPLYG